MRHDQVLKFLLILTFNSSVYGQTKFIKKSNHESHDESGLMNMDQGQYSEETAQQWIDLRENPLDLNKITREELLSLSLLSIAQINSFLNYIKIHGKLISTYELQAIPGFDINTIRKILPLVTLKTSTNYVSQPLTKRILSADNHYLVLRINKTMEKKSGFQNTGKSTFAGSEYQWLLKYRSSHSKDFSVGLTMEKDAGEKFTWAPENHQFGPDFWSFHLSLQNRGPLKNLTIGDYKLQFGQGILFGAGFNPGKGSETITTIKRSNPGIIPHTSTTENGFLRGGAATYQISLFAITIFYSHKHLDANLEPDALTSAYLVSSINKSGLHRTENEIERRKSLQEEVGGINISFVNNDKSFKLGQIISVNRHNFAPASSDKLYKKFASNKKLTGSLGYNFSYNWENFHFFGEGVWNNTNKYGLVVGVLGSISSKLQCSMLFRKYQPGFLSPYGNAFSENTDNSNEHGVYWGLKLLPFRKLTITAFMDIFKFPWLKFQVDRPSSGNEHLISLSYKFTRNTEIKGLFRQESKAINDASSSPNLNFIVTRQRKNYQLSFNHQVRDMLTLKTNLQWSNFAKAGKKSGGFSISQDLNLKWGPFRLSNRIMLFDTENFDNRHYRYEKDVLYTLALPAFSGIGYRYYTMLQAKVFRSITIWLKLARTIYFDRLVIGSGTDQINAPQKTDIRCQIRYAF